MSTAIRGDLEIYYEVHGRGTARMPAVLLMGLGADLTSWERVVPLLAGDRRLILIDQRGVGRSSRPPGVYTTADMADDVAAVLDDAGVARAHVVGLSLGGAVAQQLAIHHGRRVRSLALLATFADGKAWLEGIRRRDPELADGLLQATRVADARLLTAGLVSMVYTERFIALEKQKLRQLFESAAGADGTGLAGQLAAAFSHNTLGRLATIGAPTLLVSAGADLLVPNMLELASGLNRPKVVTIPGAPHGMHLEAPDEVAEILRGWFTAQDPPGA
jgi:pimeloyl-ACP methyl ester carboxylesterase